MKKDRGKLPLCMTLHDAVPLRWHIPSSMILQPVSQPTVFFLHWSFVAPDSRNRPTNQRRAILGGLSFLAFFLTIALCRRKNGHGASQASVTTVEELPSRDQAHYEAPQRPRYPPARLTSNSPPENPKWDKSPAVKGRPTLRFRGS